MSREIKFRVQRSDTKEWEYFTLGDLVCCSASTTGKGFDWANWCEFTGLKDAKGKEIYEGDIVSLPVGADGRQEREVVQWWEHKTGWMPFVLHHFQAYEWTVIGNIYDNPELVEKK